MRSLSLFALACSLVVVLGCGSSKKPGGTAPTSSTGNGDDGGAAQCIDRDGDGYGKGDCKHGADCNDKDPDVTDICFRCVMPNLDCPCDPGTKPVKCKPEALHADGGMLVCSEGARYCRDSYWGKCEAIGQYVFVKTAK